MREKIRVTVKSRRAALRYRRRKPPHVVQLNAAADIAYKALEPTDVLGRHEWLFRQQWVEESADDMNDEETGYAKGRERIEELRTEAVREIVAQRGVEGVLEFAEMGNAPYCIGASMTNVLPEGEIAAFILTAMPPGIESPTRRNVVHGALLAVKDKPRVSILATVGGALASATSRKSSVRTF